MVENPDFCVIQLFSWLTSNFVRLASRLLKTPVGFFLVPTMMAVLLAPLEKSEAELRELYSAARQTLTMTSEAIVYELPTYRRLTVNTLDSSGVFRCQLSVWHAPKSSHILGQLDKDKRRLSRLSNPADGSVPVSQRVFWAEWEGAVTSPYVEARIFPGVSNHVIDINVGEGAHCQ